MNRLTITASAAWLLLSLVGCAGTSTTPPAENPSAPATPENHTQKADDPIQELTSEGSHCFGTGVEAVAARLRAADAVERDNMQKQHDLDTKGVLMPYGYPFNVTDVQHNPNMTCYLVQSRGLH